MCCISTRLQSRWGTASWPANAPPYWPSHEGMNEGRRSPDSKCLSELKHLLWKKIHKTRAWCVHLLLLVELTMLPMLQLSPVLLIYIYITCTWGVKRNLISPRISEARNVSLRNTTEITALAERETEPTLQAFNPHSKSKILSLDRLCRVLLSWMCWFTNDRHTAERSDERRRSKSIRSKVSQFSQTHEQDPTPPQTAGVVRFRSALRLTHVRVFLQTPAMNH